MSTYVVDASVAVKWSFPEDYTDEALRLRASSRQLWAPDFFWLELASVVCQRIQRKMVLPEKGLDILSQFRRAPIHIFRSSELIDSATHIAIETSTSLYDCLYLALAVSHDAQMVTADRKFYRSLTQTPYARYVLWIGNIPPGVA